MATTRKRVVKIKPITAREVCGTCNDFSHIAGNDGICLYNPPIKCIDVDGSAYSLRAEVEKDDPCCRHHMPIRSN